MAKDTEKLIRQLSLISFLMAGGRPVSALEIKREVEGYSSMNDDAFARRFYADRAELESLGIALAVEKPAEGFFEAELYALPPENYYLPAIEFTDAELAALRTALGLLDGEFAYAEPLRLALQQVSWGRPSPLESDGSTSIDVKLAQNGSGRDVSQKLAKIETAISRRKTIEFSYYSLQRDETSDRKVDPYHLVFRDGQFYLIGHSHERDDVRVFRLSRIQGKVSYASKAEHDFSPPEDFDRRDYASRADWQMGADRGDRQGLPARADRLAGRARLRLLRRVPPGDQGRQGRRQGDDLRDRVRVAPAADLLGARLARQREAARAGRAGRRSRVAARAADGAPPRRVRRRQGGRSPGPGDEWAPQLQRPLRVGDPPRALRPSRHLRRDS